MTLALNDRVQQTGSANTTVSFTLSGSVTGYQSFAVVGNGNTTYYAATDTSGNWEVGIGTYSTTGPTLARTSILASSNSGSAVSTFSGTVTVFVTYPAEYATALGNVSTGSGSVVLATSPTLTTPIIGVATGTSLQVTGGFYSTSSSSFTYTDGIVIDYVSGNGRISVGGGDGITFYNGGVGTTSLGSVASSGTWTLPTLNLTNALGTGYGGTGLTTFTAANNVIYSTSSSALTAGTLPIAAGGTGQTTASAAFNALSPITTTGDLIIGNGTNSATRLAIGANNYVLTSNGTTATWAAPAASGPTKAQAIAYAMTLGF